MKALSIVKWGAVVTALVIVSNNTASASVTGSLVPDGMYVFDSTDGNTTLDGSTVTFSGDAIVSWDLLDATVSAGVDLPPLTPANSSIISSFVFGQTQYGANGWFFTIGSPVGVSSTDSSTFWFESQNELFGPGNGGGLASLYDGFGNGPSTDPDGNWNPVGQSHGDAAVPDASGTLVLLTGTLMILAAGNSLLGRRFAVQR